MAERFKHRILRHVAHEAYEPRRIQQLARDLDVESADVPAFREAVEQLVESGQVVLDAAEVLTLPPLGHEVIGRFKRHERGFGFVIPEATNAHGDLFVPAKSTGGALTGDRVRADVVHERKRKRSRGRSPYVGRIAEILQRADTRFVGTLEKRGKLHLVHTDGKTLAEPVVVRDPAAKGAHLGAKVVVELTQYPERDQLPEGVITEVLGESGDPGAETLGVCRAFSLAEKFPDDTLSEARRIVQQYNSSDEQESRFRDRLDLREDFIVTIDPPDAQDYDDAISIRKTNKGVELGIHIADVSAFVTPGSELDEQAYERGNSAYLPRLVIPMLPEVLSNGICSLQPGVPRLTKSAFITYDKDANPVSSRFANAVIESNHRLTYIEAQHLIDGDQERAREHARHDAPYTDQLITTLREMNELSKRLRKRRFRNGMITLDLPEVELVFDEQGHVIDARPEDDSYTHQLIEVFMVEANEAVARLFADLGVPLIRRIHPEPEAFDVDELRRFARVVGYSIPENPTHSEVQHLLEAVRDKPAARAVHFAVLRTLTKAEYAPLLIGHFALASEHYTHFTSPIRRYPDLSVHRTLGTLLDTLGPDASLPSSPTKRRKLGRQLRSDTHTPDEPALQDLGRHCSTTERNAEGAERELRELLVLQLLEKEHIGDVFDGTVTGVTNFGIFVQIDKYLVEGMIRTDALPGGAGEQWKVNPKTGALVAQRSGRKINIGHTFKVKITKVDLSRRELDLIIEEPAQGKKGKKKSKPTPRSRGKRKKPGKPRRNERPGGVR